MRLNALLHSLELDKLVKRADAWHLAGIRRLYPAKIA